MDDYVTHSTTGVKNEEYAKLDSINQYHGHNAWFLLDYEG
jgi:hypothetical protein